MYVHQPEIVDSGLVMRLRLKHAADYIIPATIWTIIESDVTIISVCLIVSRPWFIKLYPAKLISLIKEIPSKRSTKKSTEHSDGRKDLFSTFARLSETPPAVDASRGAPFEVDLEKYQEPDVVSDASETFLSTPNLLRSLYRPIVNEWLRSEEGWKASEERPFWSLFVISTASFMFIELGSRYACS